MLWRVPLAIDVRSDRLQPDQSHVVKRLSLSESRPRMESIVDGAQTRFDNMRVNLRRRQVCVAEHHLNRPKIGAPFEQVRGERMTDHVRAERTREVGAAA